MQRCRVMKKSIALLAGRWPSQPATRYRPSPNTSCIDAPGDPAPSHTAYRVAAPAALHAQPESPENSGRGCVLRPLCTGVSQKHPPSKETTGKHSRSSKPVWWVWLDLNQRPHPQVKIIGRGGKLPGTYQGRRGPRPLRGAVNGPGAIACCPLHPSGVAAGHEPLIRYRGLSAVRTRVPPGYRGASGAKGCVLTARARPGSSSAEHGIGSCSFFSWVSDAGGRETLGSSSWWRPAWAAQTMLLFGPTRACPQRVIAR
jgi:hypothetical protein